MAVVIKYQTLKDILRNSIVDVTFIKADGSKRRMECTLIEEFLPVDEAHVGDAVDTALSEHRIRGREAAAQTSIRVWDIEKDAWRSFKLDSIKEILIRDMKTYRSFTK